MYKSFYKLASNPFGTSPDPRFLYMMPHTREALACLEYGISARKGFIVLTGEVGTGKTTLLRRALGSFDQARVFTSFVFNPQLDVLDFLEFVLSDFGIPFENRTKSGMLIQLNRWLIERFRHQETCVIVVDEAQGLSLELLEEIRLLTNLETSSEKLVQIVLSGQPEFEEKLRLPALRQLRQRIALWSRTQAITLSQTAAYIAQRLLIAGTERQIFCEDAIEAIHRASRGIPRIINLICEHALIIGFADELEQIDESVIQTVAKDLDLDTQPFILSSSQSTFAGGTQTSDAGHQSAKLVAVSAQDSGGRIR